VFRLTVLRLFAFVTPKWDLWDLLVFLELATDTDRDLAPRLDRRSGDSNAAEIAEWIPGRRLTTLTGDRAASKEGLLLTFSRPNGRGVPSNTL
jgi:hypothetical protein